MDGIFTGIKEAVVDIGNGLGNVATAASNTFQKVGDNFTNLIIKKDPAVLAQEQLDFYNSQQLNLFCDMFSDNVIVSNLHGKTTIEGKIAFRETYENIFKEFPNNRADLVHRIVIKNKVLDHEKVFRNGGDIPTFECVAIYTIENEKIVRIDFIK